MKSCRLFVLVMVTAGLYVQLASPQEIAEKVVHLRPAAGPSAVLLDQWNEVGRKLIAMANRIFPRTSTTSSRFPAPAVSRNA